MCAPCSACVHAHFSLSSFTNDTLDHGQILHVGPGGVITNLEKALTDIAGA
jgi:hypothetical protein